MKNILILAGLLASCACLGADAGEPADDAALSASAEDVLAGLRRFYSRTAQSDGSFTPGIDPTYRGISDSAYSDLAAVTYAATIHKTFGWKLPYEKETIELLLNRQRDDGAFYNVAGTVDPASAEARCYNTTQALVALHALGAKPRRNPLAVFEDIVKHDYEKLPAYSTSFFPLAYLCYGRPIREQVDRGIRATMTPADDGYLHDHVAATFHASHYYRLTERPTPLAERMVERVLAEQKPDGSWLLNMPSRDRHATFDAVFILRQEGHGRDDCRRAIVRAAEWALSCRNADGGFGHFPGSTSDADANYFQIGTLVMAGLLKPVDPPPPDAELLSWGHLMPLRQQAQTPPAAENERPRKVPHWIGGLAFSHDGKSLAVGYADGKVEMIDPKTNVTVRTLNGHEDAVTSVAFAPNGATLATGGFDRTARLWDTVTGRELRKFSGHRGAVMTVAFSPDGRLLATGGIDGDVRLWKAATGELNAVFKGHKSWVNALAFSPEGVAIISASSDGTLRVWNIVDEREQMQIDADKAEIRSVAWSSDGKTIAAGIRYGQVKTWDTTTWRERLSFKAHGGDVWRVVFSPDGRQLFTADGDWDGPGQVKIWDTSSGRQKSVIETPSEVLAMALSADGKTLAMGGRDGRLHLRAVAEGVAP